MDAYDFVITVLALNKRYSILIENKGIINHKDLYECIIKCPPEFLKKVGIRLHPIHGDSPALDEALYFLNNNTLTQWVPGRDYSWNFVLTPKEYFEKYIKPDLKEDEISEIEKIALSLN